MASEPITQRITSDLRRQIHEGTLGPGALLPSEPEVARDYGVSRQTARSALQALEREGLVIVRPRRGRMVRSNQRLRWHLSEFERPDHTVLTTSDAWETDIESQGHDPTHQELDVEQDHAAGQHRHTAQPGPAHGHRASSAGTSATSTGSLRSSPTTTSTSASSKAPSWPSQRTPRGRTSWPRLATSRSTTSTRSSPACPHLLRSNDSGSPTGTPVAEHIRTGYTAENRPVRVMVSIIPGDTLILQYTIPT